MHAVFGTLLLCCVLLELFGSSRDNSGPAFEPDFADQLKKLLRWVVVLAMGVVSVP